MTRRIRNIPNCSVPYQHVIHTCNKGMNGVDLCDQLLGPYRPSNRGKKWHFPLVINALNTTVVAIWLIYWNIHEREIYHIDFHRETTLCSLKSANVSTSQLSVGTVADPPQDVKFDRVEHLPASFKQGRFKICSRNTRLMCSKCSVRLHRDKRKFAGICTTATCSSISTNSTGCFPNALSFARFWSS